MRGTVNKIRNQIPLVYSCSGCSSAAQMANSIALRMDREGIAEMSCIAGVGGGVLSLVKTAQSDREIIALDGCPLKCVEHCLKKVNKSPDKHIILSEYDVKKTKHQDFDKVQADNLYKKLRENNAL